MLSVLAGHRNFELTAFDNFTRERLRKALLDVQRKGFIPGAAVLLGAVSGTVIGYNVAQHSEFPGIRYPLLVSTPFGVIKASPSEVVRRT